MLLYYNKDMPDCHKRLRTIILTLSLSALCTSVCPAAQILDSVEFNGRQAFSEAQLLTTSKLKPGSRLSRKRLPASVSAIENLYGDNGFMEAKISTTSLIPVEGRIKLIFNIQEGPAYTLRDIIVQGNTEVSGSVIRREFRIKRGEPLNQTSLKETYQQLYARGCFSMIGLKISTAAGNQADVLVQITERDTSFIKGAVGYGTQSKERLWVGYENRNFMGGLRNFETRATFSGFLTEPAINQNFKLEATILQPYFLNTSYEGRANLTQEWKNREAYDSVGTTLHLSMGKKFTNALSGALTGRASYTKLPRVSPDALTPAAGNIAAPGLTAAYDTTDDRSLPSQGFRLIGIFEEGLNFLAGDVAFHKLEGKAGRFNTRGKWTFFQGLQAGVIQPHGSRKRDIIPIYERFFLGGANTVRGYTERRIGPKDSNNDPLGGTGYFVVNLEARHAIYKKLIGLAFLDSGQLYAPDSDSAYQYIKFSGINDLRHSVGAGIRLHTPAGALRVEYGYQINPESGNIRWQDRYAIHFSIGEVF